MSFHSTCCSSSTGELSLLASITENFGKTHTSWGDNGNGFLFLNMVGIVDYGFTFQNRKISASLCSGGSVLTK
jgi:hypothetical protein